MKANAYGHSIDLLMPSVMKLNVSCIGITSNAEAAMVRKHGYKGKITRLRTATDSEIINAHALNIEELLVIMIRLPVSLNGQKEQYNCSL